MLRRRFRHVRPMFRGRANRILHWLERQHYGWRNRRLYFAGHNHLFCRRRAHYSIRYNHRARRDFISERVPSIPVGFRRICSRALVTDLGFYPGENRHRPLPRFKWGRLCIWTEGKSIDIESFFPVSEAVSLANDLRKMGITFPRTYDAYDENRLAFATGDDYFSF